LTVAFPEKPEKEQPMKSNRAYCFALAVCLCFAATTRAQTGMNFFKKPNIADIFKPVVGKGALYETQRNDQKDAPKRSMEMSIVGMESVEGTDAYWMEFAHNDDRTGQMGYAKMLMTKDFQSHRMIVQQPGQQAMEFPFNLNGTDKGKQRREEELEKWSQLGTESITVPAGTFRCQHWQKEDGKSDVWVSDKVSPFGMVKMVSPGETMILVKVITEAKDHITGPVKTFDPEAFKQQMMDKRQQKQPNQ
jgi:hypothetical protein